MRGIDAWPARPSAREREAEHALLGHAHAVEAPAVVLEHLAGALVHHDVRAHLVGVLLAQPLGAVLGAGLLVGGDHELQLARCGPPALLGQRHRGGHLGRHLALHVQRAAAPDAAVLELARPRVHVPLGRVGEHGVHVAQQAQHGPVGVGRQPRRPGSAAPRRPPAARPRSRRASSSSFRNSWSACSLPGGLTVSKRIRRCSSSVVRRSRSAGSGTVRVSQRSGAQARAPESLGAGTSACTSTASADRPR